MSWVDLGIAIALYLLLKTPEGIRAWRNQQIIAKFEPFLPYVMEFLDEAIKGGLSYPEYQEKVLALFAEAGAKFESTIDSINALKIVRERFDPEKFLESLTGDRAAFPEPDEEGRTGETPQ